MVTDTIDNYRLYTGLGVNMKKALEYLDTTDFETVAPGKYTIVENEIYAIVNEFETKDKGECQPEAHVKFTDIQFVVKGIELFGYAPLMHRLPVTEYDEANDVSFYREKMNYLQLEAGMFIIFYPTDIHQPEVRAFEPMMVKKVVMKVKR
ncbi:MAG: YhcH/YjgK/YiaL family protein [Chitinophagaceae bacterium]|nr:YhcH/YjgK/YiaL family protein [Chitinophagaceae bacterium]